MSGHIFKEGDRVRIAANNGGYFRNESQGLYPGGTGTIARVYEGGGYDVLTDAKEAHDGAGFGWFFAGSCLEPIAETAGAQPSDFPRIARPEQAGYSWDQLDRDFARTMRPDSEPIPGREDLGEPAHINTWRENKGAIR